VSKCKLVTNRGKAVTMLYGTGGEAQEEVPSSGVVKIQNKVWCFICSAPKEPNILLP
jgi:hypothetical protein